MMKKVLNSILNFLFPAQTGILFLAGILISMLTFPDNDWGHAPGIDPPLSWVFNHFFSTGFLPGRDILFPHGPLAFFLYPLPENILFFQFVLALQKILLLFSVNRFLQMQRKHHDALTAFVIVYFICIVGDFKNLLLANLIVLYGISFQNSGGKDRFTAFVLTAIAFFIKANLAILSGMLFCSYQCLVLLRNKNLKKVATDVGVLLVCILLIWVWMYDSPAGLLRYVAGMLQLAQDNSSAASEYPYNDWWLLTLFLLSFPVLLIFNRDKKFYFFAGLIALSLFGAWKHGMAREDIYHAEALLVYLIICGILLFLFYREKPYQNLLIVGTGIFFFAANTKHAVNYQAIRYPLINATACWDFVTHYRELCDASEQQSKQAIAESKLPKQFLDSIGQATVDVYPWDYSLIPANGLNWQPRVVINSYASYTTFLDGENARHFASEKAPAFLLWQYRKNTTDINGGMLSSIDNRYLPNDEPLTMLQLLSGYEACLADANYLLLKKKKKPLPFSSHETGEKKTTWNTWIEVPETGMKGLLRARLAFEKSLLQRLKSFFYKDEQFWIQLKLDNGEIHKYRIVPANAVDGLWINPYVPGGGCSAKVKSILFTASNQNILHRELKVKFEQFDFGEPDLVQQFFTGTYPCRDTCVLHAVQDFEKESVLGWSSLPDSLLVKDAASGKFSCLLPGGAFSSTYAYPLDSLPVADYTFVMEMQVHCRGNEKNLKASAVLSIENKDGAVVWNGIPPENQCIDRSRWNHVYQHQSFRNEQKGLVLKAYLYNEGKENMLIDDLGISMYRRTADSLVHK
ncbi:MAG: hypothetical protein ACK5D8_03960 [Bacteroidota bacterium]